jgi:hypothetical protein
VILQTTGSCPFHTSQPSAQTTTSCSRVYLIGFVLLSLFLHSLVCTSQDLCFSISFSIFLLLRRPAGSRKFYTSQATTRMRAAPCSFYSVLVALLYSSYGVHQGWAAQPSVVGLTRNTSVDRLAPHAYEYATSSTACVVLPTSTWSWQRWSQEPTSCPAASTTRTTTTAQ